MSHGITNGLVFGGSVTLDPHSVTLDAGGFLRVAQQTTLLDGKILNADDTSIWETVGTGTGTYTNNKYNMAVTSGQYLVRQTKRRYPYYAGKSQRVELTLDGFGVDADTIKRYGYFSSVATGVFDSAYDGFWLENDGTTITLKAARSGTETLSKDITEWTGYANLAEYQTLSTWDNFTVCEFKFLWLGGAVLVLSIKNSLGFVEAHRFDYSGTATDVFISSPNQPVRYEIRSSTGAGSMRYICSQVATEGSINESGYGIAVFNTTAIACNTVGTIYALLGLKKSTTYRDTAIQITDIAIANTASTDAGILLLVQSPTLSGALTYNANSRHQLAIATNQTLTAGTGRILAAQPISSAGGGTNVMSNNFLGWMSSTLADAHTEYVLAFIPTTNNQTLNGVINLKEY